VARDLRRPEEARVDRDPAQENSIQGDRQQQQRSEPVHGTSEKSMLPDIARVYGIPTTLLGDDAMAKYATSNRSL
jgi:hypothetical protein